MLRSHRDASSAVCLSASAALLSAAAAVMDRSRGGSSPPPPPPTVARQPSVVPPPPQLPGAGEDGCSDGESPPPPPSDFPSEFLLPPPPPPPVVAAAEDGEIDDFEAAIRASGAAGTSAKSQPTMHLMASPPPPPSTFLEDDSDDDDSDVEGDRDSSTLNSSSITPDDVVSPLGLNSKPPPPARSNSKLSFTAPTTSSPLSSGPQPPAAVNSTSKFEVVPAAPAAPLNNTAPPTEGISLSTLSSQLSLHMEIQTFAANRRASLIAGASPASLIPGTAASPVAVAASSTPANAAVSSGGTVRFRPTHGIRSMSMSMQQSPFASAPFSSAGGGASGVVAAGASNPFATPKKRRRRTSRPAAASKRSDAEVLDLFGDGPQTPVPDLRTSLLTAATSSPQRSSSSRLKQPASASALLASINEAADDDGDIPPPPPPPLPEHGAPGGIMMHAIEEEEVESNGRLITPAGGLAQPVSLFRAGSQRNSVDVSAQALHSILTTSNASSLGSRKNSTVNPTYNPPVASLPLPVGPSSLALPPEEDVAPEALALQNDSDDLTASFQPPPTHIGAHFPYRKVLRTPLRTTACLQLPPLETVTEAQIDSQMRVLSLLSEALRSSRNEFRTMCVTNLRAENEALRQRINELRLASGSGGAGTGGLLAAGSRGPPAGRSLAGLGGLALEQQQRETLRRSMRALAPHARWNQALHAVHDKLTLELDEMRRRCQFQLPAATNGTSFGGAEDYLNQTAPHSADPAAAASVASARNTPQQQPRSLLISPADMKPPARGNQTPYGSARGDLLSPSSPAAVPGEFPGGGGLHAQLQRFPITKINMIRKNTPRIFELDLTTKTLTICKNVKSSSSSKEKDASASKDDDFANRDIVISAATLVSAELHPKQELQFELSFHVTQAPSASGMMAPSSQASSGSKDKSEKKGDSTKEKSSTLKNWKILFASRDERERFYRLLQVTLLSSETPTPASTPAAAASSAALRPHAMGGAAAGSRGAFDGTSSDALSTSYPQPGGGPHATLTYTPRPAQLTPAILQQVRVLPLLPLASSLHTIYCLTKKNAGWKYGLKLVSETAAPGGDWCSLCADRMVRF